MKPALRSLAQAFVDTAATLKPEQRAELCDGALKILSERGLGTPRDFLHVVRSIVRSHKGSARLVTAKPVSAAQSTSLQKTIHDALRTPITYTEREVPGLLGGAVLQCGDERFDASALGMLQRAAASLLAA